MHSTEELTTWLLAIGILAFALGFIIAALLAARHVTEAYSEGYDEGYLEAVEDAGEESRISDIRWAPSAECSPGLQSVLPQITTSH